MARDFGVVPAAPPVDLGGSSNLNLLIVARGRRLVVRVYRPSVSVRRLQDIQAVRRRLAAHGFPCALSISSAAGDTWSGVGDRLFEVEEYVPHDGRMNTRERAMEGLRMLGAMHDVLASISLSEDGRVPRFVNYLAPDSLVDATGRGIARMRSWANPGENSSLAATAEELAQRIADAQAAAGYGSLPRQIVHGDFWDGNVLYRVGRIVLVHDFDHMGERARIEDVALTAYFTCLESGRELRRDARSHLVARLLAAYESGLRDPLEPAEREAFPVALARQPLWSVGGWIADLDDENAARAHARGLRRAIELALDVLDDSRKRA